MVRRFGRIAEDALVTDLHRRDDIKVRHDESITNYLQPSDRLRKKAGVDRGERWVFAESDPKLENR